MGYQLLGWTLDPGDWDSSRIPDAAALVEWAERTRLPKDPTLILFHTWPDSTCQAIEHVIDVLRTRDAKFVRVSDLCDPHSCQ
jgi:peptidoglycan/xylan/chitin deacetylase (PgdA/CDA1 family)